jgi:hypothetical protein
MIYKMKIIRFMWHKSPQPLIVEMNFVAIEEKWERQLSI